jgi:predicted MPP superfamily phosphohydrolase
LPIFKSGALLYAIVKTFEKIKIYIDTPNKPAEVRIVNISLIHLTFFGIRKRNNPIPIGTKIICNKRTSKLILYSTSKISFKK